MKVYKEPTWQLETTGGEGNVTLFGVNIFGHEWIDTGKKAKIVNPSDGTVAYLPVNAVVIDGKECEFVCEEQSNSVYNFYIYRY